VSIGGQKIGFLRRFSVTLRHLLTAVLLCTAIASAAPPQTDARGLPTLAPLVNEVTPAERKPRPVETAAWGRYLSS
jgi:di/tricarboxylate transporter